MLPDGRNVLLSICIPTFNRCRYLKVSAAYWLEQLGPFAGRAELIIADNGSEDGTVEWLRSSGAGTKFQMNERGRNIGFNASVYDLVSHHATGEFVWVCGDDDYLNPGGLTEVMRALEGHREQDHFHLNTQFIPNDHLPDLEREDPRQSSHIHLSGADFSSGTVARTSEIVGRNGEDFSGLYSSIWRRTMALEALSGEFVTVEPFHSLGATLPYAVFVARYRLQQVCFCIGTPVLTVSHSVSWPQYASLFRLKIRPDLCDLYEKNGVLAAALREMRSDLLEHWPLAYLDLWRHRDRAHGFGFGGYLLRRIWSGRFWRELFRAFWCDFLP
jgi:glycosyltransferase involved in cell wall biosynthesis